MNKFIIIVLIINFILLNVKANFTQFDYHISHNFTDIMGNTNLNIDNDEIFNQKQYNIIPIVIFLYYMNAF